MKSKITIPAIAIILIAFFSVFSFSKVKAQSYGEVSFGVFYDELSPHGYWDNDPSYGDIWFPHVPAGFRPYSTNGYWAMTEYGNTWVSNYPWGWAPFHYGRWVHTSYRGWGWIPGYEWGPAWVDWRSGNGYYGWAPMAPRVGVHISIGVPLNLWVFAPVRHIYARNIYRYSHYGRANIYNRTTIINNTYIVNNRHYYGGPSRRDIERSTGRAVQVRSIRQADRPGVSRVDNRSVAIYRPDRDQNRTASNRSSGNGTVRGAENTRSNNVGNTTRVGTDRNANPIATPRREMHIDGNGNATIRERANSSTTRQGNQGNNTDNRATADRNTGRTSATPTTRPTEQRSSENVQRAPQQRSSTQQAQPVSPRENNTRNQGTTQRSNTRQAAPQTSTPQRQQGTPQQRTPQPTRTTSTPPVQQASSRTQGSSISRQSTPRVQNSSSTTSSSARSSTTSTSRSSTSNGSSSSRR